MACIPGIPAACLGNAASGIAGGLATGVLGNGFADAMRDGAAWVIKTTIGWWIAVPSLDLTDSPAARIRSYVLWLGRRRGRRGHVAGHRPGSVPPSRGGAGCR